MLFKRNNSITTNHGEIKLPCFIFCATRAALKTVPVELIPSNTQIILCNTFHLQNYSHDIEKLGGVHKFMNWNKPMIADSGGFQIFSLGHGHIADEIKGIRRSKSSIVKINEKGCVFKSPINGDLQVLDAEESINIQHRLGVDLLISFDECTASHSGYEYTKLSMERSKRWSLRSLNHFKTLQSPHKLYGIIQGGIYKDLRDESIDFVNNNDFYGCAIGGSLGKTKEEMYDIVKYTAEKLNPKRPRHLLGIGEIEDIIELYPYIDTFDCVEPTRIARHGTAIIPGNGKISLRRSRFKLDNSPIYDKCECTTCCNYSKAYIHYLLKIKEQLAFTLLSIHNIFTMNTLMEHIRSKSINEVKSLWLS
jgi:queuine tRNA-ribosyltransferase